MRVVLTIGGSDSSCGAGIQADLKTLQACGVYGVCAVTAVTAQDSARVARVFPIPPTAVSSQIDTVVRELRVGAVKTGMLWSRGNVLAVRRSILEHGLRNIVVDPVLASHRGVRLLSREAYGALLRYLLPLADLVTPNIPEAEEIAGITISREKDIDEAARRILDRGPRAVLIKGGHGRGAVADWYYDGRQRVPFRSTRRRNVKLHGSGCILAAAIAAGLAKGMPRVAAIRNGRAYVERQMRKAWVTGRGGALALHA
ncbi:MAG: bifunctional hydroxymethylpyrimidine kinase/phosphomethylpyrimidine kinase [Candidatus Aureabacteria bacterium]|nr:bifunctional hydroxymethylpyrimidine kinase/phosphomethylpyrimidine kinase [Candidatus Auribacterota bacterium]